MSPISNIGKSHTLLSAFRCLKQAGFSTSRDAVREYVHWAEDSWLLSNVAIYSNSIKEQERNYKKIYAIDWGLANRNSLIWDGSYSRAFENMVFIHLYRKWHRIHYYLTKKKRQEVDAQAWLGYTPASSRPGAQRSLLATTIKRVCFSRHPLTPPLTNALLFGGHQLDLIDFRPALSGNKYMPGLFVIGNTV